MVDHLLVAAPGRAACAGTVRTAARLVRVGGVLAGRAEARHVDGLFLHAPGAARPVAAVFADLEVAGVEAGDEVFLGAVAHGCGLVMRWGLVGVILGV